jgi:hypothetical protein
MLMASTGFYNEFLLLASQVTPVMILRVQYISMGNFEGICLLRFNETQSTESKLIFGRTHCLCLSRLKSKLSETPE